MAELRDGLLNVALKFGLGVDKKGKQYHWLIDCREMLLTGEYLSAAAQELWFRIKHLKPRFVAGMTLAANPLTIAVMLEAKKNGEDVDGLIIRKEPKADGLQKQIEGRDVPAGARVVILDDIVNSGDTQKQAVAALSPSGAEVVGVASIVDCVRGGHQYVQSKNIELISLFTLNDLGIAKSNPKSETGMKWNWKIGPINTKRNGIVKSSPVIFEDLIFIGSDSGFVSAVTTHGSEVWRFMVRDTERGVHSTPAVFEDSIVFGAYDGFLYRVDKRSGESKWETRLGQWIGSSPVVVAEHGLICVGVESGEAGGALVAISAGSGVENWRFDTKQYVHGSPVYDREREQIIFGSNDCTLYSVDLHGQKRWQFISGGEIKAKPAIDQDGRCYFGSFDGYCYALNALDGTPIWRRRLGISVYFTPLVVGDVVIIGSDSYRLVAYSRTSGKVRWVFSAGASIRGGASIIEGGRIAFGSRDGVIYVLDASNGKCLQQFTTGDEILSGPEWRNGHLFVSSLDGYVYSFLLGTIAG